MSETACSSTSSSSSTAATTTTDISLFQSQFQSHAQTTLILAIDDSNISIARAALSSFNETNCCDLLFQSNNGQLDHRIQTALAKVKGSNFETIFENFIFPYRLSAIFHHLQSYAAKITIISSNNNQKFELRKNDFQKKTQLDRS